MKLSLAIIAALSTSQYAAAAVSILMWRNNCICVCVPSIRSNHSLTSGIYFQLLYRRQGSASALTLPQPLQVMVAWQRPKHALQAATKTSLKTDPATTSRRIWANATGIAMKLITHAKSGRSLTNRWSVLTRYVHCACIICQQLTNVCPNKHTSVVNTHSSIYV